MTKAGHNVICYYHYYMLSPLRRVFTITYKKQTMFLGCSSSVVVWHM